MKNFPSFCIDDFYEDPDYVREFALKEINSGTSVFRLDNKETVSMDQEEKKNFYISGEFGKDYETALSRHNSSYTETVRFNNIYNRIIGFDASSYHGVNSYYDKNQSRLTQVFFIHRINSDSQTPIIRCKSY